MAENKKTIKLVQKKSAIGISDKQLGSLKGLGLGKVGSKSELIDTPAVRGMIAKVSHLLEVSDDK